MHWLGPITFLQANMHEYFNNTHTLYKSLFHLEHHHYTDKS